MNQCEALPFITTYDTLKMTATNSLAAKQRNIQSYNGGHEFLV